MTATAPGPWVLPVGILLSVLLTTFFLIGFTSSSSFRLSATLNAKNRAPTPLPPHMQTVDPLPARGLSQPGAMLARPHPEATVCGGLTCWGVENHHLGEGPHHLPTLPILEKLRHRGDAKPHDAHGAGRAGRGEVDQGQATATLTFVISDSAGGATCPVGPLTASCLLGPRAAASPTGPHPHTAPRAHVARRQQQPPQPPPAAAEPFPVWHPAGRSCVTLGKWLGLSVPLALSGGVVQLAGRL